MKRLFFPTELSSHFSENQLIDPSPVSLVQFLLQAIHLLRTHLPLLSLCTHSLASKSYDCVSSWALPSTPPQALGCLNCLLWWGMQFIIMVGWGGVGAWPEWKRNPGAQRNEAGWSKGLMRLEGWRDTTAHRRFKPCISDPLSTRTPSARASKAPQLRKYPVDRSDKFLA